MRPVARQYVTRHGRSVDLRISAWHRASLSVFAQLFTLACLCIRETLCARREPGDDVSDREYPGCEQLQVEVFVDEVNESVIRKPRQHRSHSLIAMSSRRTSSRTKTVTPGRDVTTLKNPAKASRNGKNGADNKPAKGSKAARYREEDDDSEPESELSEEEHDDEDVYRGSEEDEVIQEDSPSKDEVDSDDIDEPTSKRTGAKRKTNGSSKKSPVKKQKVVKKAASKPVKTATAIKKNGKAKANAGDNYPVAADSDAGSEAAGTADDYSSYSDGEGDGDSDESLELEEGQEIKGYVKRGDSRRQRSRA
jgi:hypothetical protein